MAPRTRMVVSPTGVWVYGVLSTIAFVVIMIFGVVLLTQGGSGGIGGTVFMVIWFVLAVGFYVNNMRLLITRHTIWAMGYNPGIPFPFVSYETSEPDRSDRPDSPPISRDQG